MRTQWQHLSIAVFLTVCCAGLPVFTQSIARHTHAAARSSSPAHHLRQHTTHRAPVIPRRSHARYFDGSVSALLSIGDDTADRSGVDTRSLAWIAVGGDHHLATREDGALIAWGSNTKGQSTVPTALSPNSTNPETILSFDAGNAHNIVLSQVMDPGTERITYKARAWGDNTNGQTTIPASVKASTTMPLAVAAGDNHSLAYIFETDAVAGTTTASVVCWGSSCASTVPTALVDVDPSLFTVTELAAQGTHNAALLSDGRIIEWYVSGASETHTPVDNMPYTAIAVGADFLLALDANGLLHAFGSNTNGQLDIPADVPCWSRVSAGAAHVVAVACDGTSYAWGDNSAHQAELPPEMQTMLGDIAHIASRGNHTLVFYTIAPSYTLQRWGADPTDLPAIRTDIQDMTAGIGHNLAVISDSTVIGWGNNDAGQLDIPAGLINPLIMATGAQHSVAVDPTGVLTAWGSNDAGQLDIPQNLGRVVTAAAGRDFTIVRAISDTVTLDEWGFPVTIDTTTIWGNPKKTLPPGIADATDIKCYDNHCVAAVVDVVTVAGEPVDQTRFVDWLYTDDSTGAKTVITRVPPNTDTNYDPYIFAVGANHLLAAQYYYHADFDADPPVENYSLKIRGFAIGTAPAGVTTEQFLYNQDSIDMPEVDALAAGAAHSVALLDTGEVRCWPTTATGCAIPANLVHTSMIAAGKNYTLAMAFLDPSRAPTATSTATDTPTPSNTRTPTHTKSPTPTKTATRTPSSTPTKTATRTPSSTPSRTATRTPSNTPSPTRTPTATNTKSPTYTPSETNTKSPTPTKTASRTPSTTRTPSDTPTPSDTRTATYTRSPTLTKIPPTTRTRTPTVKK